MLVDAVAVVVRALGYIALLQAVGTVIFSVVFGQRLVETRAAVRSLALVSTVVAGAVTVLQYLLEAGRLSGELRGMVDPSLQSIVLHSPASTALVLRLLGLGLIGFGLPLRRGRVGVSIALAGGALSIAAFASVGHTATHSPRWLLAALVILHGSVVAFWFGALLPLRSIAARESPPLAGAIVKRFSALAVWVVPGLFVFGALLAAFLLPSVAALGTAYGRLLLGKATGFAMLIALASLNRWRFVLAIERADAVARRAFRQTVAAEYALIAAVLCVTAVLTTFYSPDA
jgi:copper transport protein